MPKSQIKGRFFWHGEPGEQQKARGSQFALDSPTSRHQRVLSSSGQLLCPSRCSASKAHSTAALVLSFRETDLQEKMTFLEVAFYLHHETAGCSCRMWCRITILSTKTILKRFKVTWVLWGLVTSKSRMPNLHFQGYKLSTAVQATAWLKRNKPGASHCLLKSSRAHLLLTLSSAEAPGLPEAP